MIYSNHTPKPTEITISHHSTKVTVELPWDSSLDEVYNALRGLLITVGWSDSQVDSEILSQAEYVNEKISYKEGEDLLNNEEASDDND